MNTRSSLAILATFAPSLPAATDCGESGACVVGIFGQIGFIFFRALNFAVEVASYTAGAPVTNTWVQIQLYAP